MGYTWTSKQPCISKLYFTGLLRDTVAVATKMMWRPTDRPLQQAQQPYPFTGAFIYTFWSLDEQRRPCCYGYLLNASVRHYTLFRPWGISHFISSRISSPAVPEMPVGALPSTDGPPGAYSAHCMCQEDHLLKAGLQVPITACDSCILLGVGNFLLGFDI